MAEVQSLECFQRKYLISSLGCVHGNRATGEVKRAESTLGPFSVQRARNRKLVVSVSSISKVGKFHLVTSLSFP